MFQDLFKKRRSMRKFTKELLTDEEISMILQAGLNAPTGRNRKPVEFIVVKDPNCLKKLAGFKKIGADFLKEVAAAIVVLADTELGVNTYIQDASIAASYIQLQTADLGLGSCWCHVRGGGTEEGAEGEALIKEWLKIPNRYFVQCIIGIGHIDEEVEERPIFYGKDKVHYEIFESKQ